MKNLSDTVLLRKLKFYRVMIRAYAGIDNKKSNDYFDKHEKVENELVRRGYGYNEKNIMVKIKLGSF